MRRILARRGGARAAMLKRVRDEYASQMADAYPAVVCRLTQQRSKFSSFVLIFILRYISEYRYLHV